MRVLFLDIDGVLNNNDTWNNNVPGNDLSTKVEKLQKDLGVSYDTAISLGMLDEKLVDKVREISLELDLTIVLSSVWRFHKDIFELFSKWFDVKIFSVTPRLSDLEAERGDEIQEWLDQHPEVTDFVILDDDVDMAHLGDRLVQTTFETGVTEQHLDQIRTLLDNS